MGNTPLHTPPTLVCHSLSLEYYNIFQRRVYCHASGISTFLILSHWGHCEKATYIQIQSLCQALTQSKVSGILRRE